MQEKVSNLLYRWSPEVHMVGQAPLKEGPTLLHKEPWLSINSLIYTTVGLFIYLFGVLRHFQHCTNHIMTGSWKGRGNQYIQFVGVLYCKLPTNGKQLPAFPLEAMPGTEPWPQRWEARVLLLCHRGPYTTVGAAWRFILDRSL